MDQMANPECTIAYRKISMKTCEEMGFLYSVSPSFADNQALEIRFNMVHPRTC